jgi:diguanylate cyclase (GGDEF)-like protein
LNIYEQAKLKVLILDSDQDFIDGIVESCGDRAWLLEGKCITSKNRSEVSNIVLGSCPDIVVVNLDIDQGQGPSSTLAKCAKEIRLVPVSPPVKIFAYTSSESRDLKEEAFKAGVDDFLIRPFTWRDLWFKLDIIARNRMLQIDLDEAARKLSQLNRKLVDTNKKLEEMTITDELTGLSNMRYMARRLEESFSGQRRNVTDLALMMIDLDSFKQVNDDNNHLAGSAMIKAVGEIIKDTLRDIDLKARYGGDEYIVALPHTSREGALIVAERLRERIEKVRIEEADVKVTASIGMANYDESRHHQYKDLIRDADAALYKSKHQGKNRVSVFDGTVERGYDESQSAIFTEIKKTGSK